MAAIAASKSREAAGAGFVGGGTEEAWQALVGKSEVDLGESESA